MAQNGHAVCLFCIEGSPLAKAAAECHNVDVAHFERQRRYFPWGAARRMAVRMDGFDALWVRDPRDLAFAGLAAERAGIRFIFQQGMQFSKRKRMPWHRARFGRVTDWVSPLEHLREEAMRMTPLRPEQVRVIPLGLDSTWFDPPPFDREAARKMLDLPGEPKIVGCFGRIDPLKGQDVLVQALHMLPEEWHALFIGENTVNATGQFKEEVVRLAKQLGVSDRVHWRPYAATLRPAYHALDVYAMTSRSETIGMVTLEAQACRIPVAGTDSGGTPELLGKDGALFPPGNPEACARAIQQALEAGPGPRLPTHEREVRERWQELLNDWPPPS
jgi:glycosyltransferase involved in cell wall biosynthesis